MDNNINQTIIEKVAIKSVAIYKAIAMLPPPEIKDLWAENNYTKQTQNDLKLDAKDNCVTMKKTKTESTPVDWRDITDPKLRKKMYDKYRYELKKDEIRTRNKNWNAANKDKVRNQSKAWEEANKDKRKLQIKNWRNINKDKIKKQARIREKTRIKNDIQYKLACRLRVRLRDALKSNYKVGSAVKDLGCTLNQLKTYLESKFQPGMTWDNHGFYGWHIDHIKPLASFDLSDRKQLLEACHYTNLQPLWAKDNLSKNDNII